MNPNNKQNPTFNSSQPTGNGIFGTPAENTSNGNPVTATTLKVPFASPTHFDVDANQIPASPRPGGQPAMIQAAPGQPTAQTPQIDPKDKTIKKFSVMSTVFGIFMVIFLGLAIWGLAFGISTSEELGKTKTVVASQKSIIDAVETATQTKITAPEDVPIFKTTHGYIYFDEWRIKLKVPEDLGHVSYLYDQNDSYRARVCFTGMKNGTKYYPPFADLDLNRDGMGCLLRVDTTEGSIDKETGLSFGLQVFTHENYNFFYVEPGKLFSETESEQGLEQTAIQLIKNMLSGDNISSYE